MLYAVRVRPHRAPITMTSVAHVTVIVATPTYSKASRPESSRRPDHRGDNPFPPIESWVRFLCQCRSAATFPLGVGPHLRQSGGMTLGEVMGGGRGEGGGQ